MKKVTLRHVKQAVIYLNLLGPERRKKVYNQQKWGKCSTRFCIWGHANVIAGNMKKVKGKSHPEYYPLSRAYIRLDLRYMLESGKTSFSSFKEYFKIGEAQ